jgi:hypothetical protein
MELSNKTIRILVVLLLLPAYGCGPARPGRTAADSYRLPSEHSDNANPLKIQFFREPFVDLNGKELTIEDFRGTPLVIMVYPFFRTDRGREGLMGLERLVRERQGQFQALVIPFEEKETIQPAIKSEMEGLSFVFRADGESNDTFIDKYSSLFWDENIISADFPLDPESIHQSCPFYWIVDRAGRIREKLIDYSGERGVRPVEVAMVLDALLGVQISEPESAFEGSSVDEDIESSGDIAETSD